MKFDPVVVGSAIVVVAHMFEKGDYNIPVRALVLVQVMGKYLVSFPMMAQKKMKREQRSRLSVYLMKISVVDDG
jgi:hypothetical protein